VPTILGGVMSKLSKLAVKEVTLELEYPEIDGFVVFLNYVSREDLAKIRQQSVSIKFNKVSRQREEIVDNDKFIEAWATKAIKGWKGLKFKHLPKLLPVDISSQNPETDFDWTVEDALDLLKNSPAFDQFVTDAMNDYEKFSIKKAETETKN